MPRQRVVGSLWKQLEKPLHRDALEAMVAAHGAESLLPVLLELLGREKSGSTRAGLGCLGYTALFGVCFMLATLWTWFWVFPILQLLFSPVMLFIAFKLGHEQTVRRTNLLRLLRLTAHELKDGSKVPELIRAVRTVSNSEDPVLRRELRQELGRLLLRLPTEQARRLTGSERAALRGWLWEAMKWDQTEAGDTEFCLAALLALGDAQDQWVRPHAWLCARWHRAPQVRAAASACQDALSTSGPARSE